MKAARISRPSAVRMGMFCRFGFDDDSRPVAAPAWLKLVCRRPVRASICAGSASTYVPLSLVSWRYSSTWRTISCSGASASRMSAAVERVFPLPYFTGAGSFKSSNSTSPKLLRRADVERPPGQPVDVRGEARNLRLHQRREALQFDRVDADAGALHARQHAGQRQFDGGVEFAQAARVDGRFEHAKSSSTISACCSGEAPSFRSRRRRACSSSVTPPGSASSRKAYSMMSC
jgi:hypothetical protein